MLLALAAPAHAQIVRPPELRLQFHRAERAFRTGSSPHEAKRRLDMVLEQLPEDSEALMLRASVLLALEQPEAALRDAQAAVRLRPTDGEAHLLLSEAARAAGSVRLAISALDRAGELIRGGAPLHVRLSINARALGELDQAEAFARLAQTQDPSLPSAHLQLARVFMAKDRATAAATVLASALESGVLMPRDVRSDGELAALVNHPDLARWFAN